MYGFAHAAVALVLGAILRLPVVTMLLAAMAPDLDTFLPIPHRGPAHTPFAAIGLGLVLFLLTDDRRTALAAVVGHSSHLFIDTFTYSGIMWLFPWRRSFSLGLLEASSASGNLLLIGYALVAFVIHRRQHLARRWWRSIR